MKILHIRFDVIRLEEKKSELEEHRMLLLDEIHRTAISGDVDQEACDNIIKEIDDEIQDVESRLEELLIKDLNIDSKSGICFLSIGETLKKIGVDRQAYYGGTIIGNHCHLILKEKNIDIICKSIPSIVKDEVGDGDIYHSAVEQCSKFNVLFKLYSKCHNVFNSSCHLTEQDIAALQLDIEEFMAYLRLNWPDVSISPKLHMVEEHIVPFLSQWHVGCGFLGEQGGESIHKCINSMKSNYSNIRNNKDKLKYIMDSHLSTTSPEARAKRVTKKPRNLKRKTSV